MSFVNAAVSGYCINIEVSDITPSSIGIDDEFTVEVQVESCGSKIPNNVSVTLFNPYDDIIVKENSVINVGALEYTNSRRSIIYHMRTTENARQGNYQMTITAEGGSDTISVSDTNTISLVVDAEESKLSIASVKTNPVLPNKGETVELTLRIENFGDGTANSVRVYADHPFSGTKESFIGTLESDEDGPAVFTFIADAAGEFKIPITVTYKDDFGEKEIDSEINLVILQSRQNIPMIISVSLTVVIFSLIIIYLFRRSRKKEKIIQQLLMKNSHSATSPKKKKTRKKK